MAGIRLRNSGMTNDDSIGFGDQEETSSLDSIEWTNEKHSMYLKSMEASFIDQLYNSKDLFSWCPPEEHGFDVKLCSQGRRHGSGKKELYKTALQHEGVDGYGTFLANPYAHFTATDNNAIEQQPLGSGGQILASCRPGNISRKMVDGENHQVSLSFNEEVSDQNFINEQCENRAERGKRAKRPRIQDASAPSSNDQVVPFSISHLSVQDHCNCCSDSRDRMIGRSGCASNRN